MTEHFEYIAPRKVLLKLFRDSSVYLVYITRPDIEMATDSTPNSSSKGSSFTAAEGINDSTDRVKFAYASLFPVFHTY